MMAELKKSIEKFLDDCRYMRGLSEKTLKAYTIDLNQFLIFCIDKPWNSKETLEGYIKELYIKYKPKTVKRKIACLKTYFHYLENSDLILSSPFNKISIKRREPFVLPKVIPTPVLAQILETAYIKYSEPYHTEYYYKCITRDIAVLELLFSTGVRVQELCNLKISDVDLRDRYIKVNGKGSKERYIQLTNKDVVCALRRYQKEYCDEIRANECYFINNRGNKLSEQSVRFMVNKYTKLVDANLHITPHMFRHTVATLLLEEDVDIRYIQEFLGHSSITTTQIYTHVSLNAQKKIFAKKHPRNKLKIKTDI